MTNPAVAQGQGLLDALASLTAFDAGMYDEVMEVAGDPFAFAGALLLASRLAEEVDRLGGDSTALRQKIGGRAELLAATR